MPTENALAFLRSNASAHALPAVIVIAGPHAFLREYVLDSIAQRLAGEGFRYRSFQIGSGDDYGDLISEMRGQDLFAPRRLIACRVLRSRRERVDDDEAPDAAGEARRGSGVEESALADMIAE